MKKILISSDCNGNFDFLLSKIQSLQKKNSFDFVICIGNVFASPPIIKPEIKFHIPIYFIDSGEMSKSLGLIYPDGYEIVKNFTFLGRTGVKNIQGVNVAFLNGVQNNKDAGFYGNQNNQYSSNYFTYKDYEQLMRKKDEKIDLFLSNNWPEDSQRQPPLQAKHQSTYVSKLVGALAPRYHFSALEGVYYKRDEYENKKKYSTAFISVAPITLEGQNKAKYLHAIQIVPFSALTTELAKNPNIPKDPFFKYSHEQLKQKQSYKITYPVLSKSKGKESHQTFTTPPIIYFSKFNEETHTSQIQQFLERWGQIKELNAQNGTGTVVFKQLKTAKECLNQSGKYSLYGSRIKFSLRNQNNKLTQPNCWFCPQSKVFDKSLVVFTGKKIYMAVDKGPIVPLHFQIVPYPHIQSLITCDQSIKTEIQSTISLLQSKLLKQHKSLIIYTHYLPLHFSKNHAVIHCLPVQNINLAQYTSLFQRKVNYQKLDFIKISQQSQNEQIEKNRYFKIQIGSNIYIKIVKQKHFSVDFGRSSMCQIMDLMDKVNWKGCINDEETQKAMNVLRQMIQQQ